MESIRLNNLEEFKKSISDRLTEDFKENFNKGLVAGFNAGITVSYEAIKNETSAKKIKEILKNKVKETEDKFSINLVDVGVTQP